MQLLLHSETRTFKKHKICVTTSNIKHRTYYIVHTSFSLRDHKDCKIKLIKYMYYKNSLAITSMSHLNFRCGFEVTSEGHQSELGCIPQLVTEEAIALNTKHVQVDVAPWKNLMINKIYHSSWFEAQFCTLRRVRKQSKSKSIGATFRNSLRIV